jgi:menaquinol-cytochrome c reductase cytochrome b/c subunit
MSTPDSKDFVAGVGSDQRKSPVRVAFVTRRTSAQVKERDESVVQSFPEVLFRAAIAVQALACVLVLISLFFNAPLEGLADPSHTPNPAKAPWYFLGLQELLHYFPPVVAGVLVPTLVVLALIVIPYFNINIEAEGLFIKDRDKRLKIFWAVSIVLCIFLLVFDVIVALVPTVITVALMALAATTPPNSPSAVRRSLAAKPLSFWIMSWFLVELVVLTAVGTLFRGPGWSWVLPWRSY